MTREQVRCLLADDEGAWRFEGPEFDAAIVGLLERFDAPRVVCYDAARVIWVLIKKQGMDESEAREWFEVNILGPGSERRRRST